MCLQIIYLIYMYKQDLALDNQQWLICHKTKPTQTKPWNYKYKFLVLIIVTGTYNCLLRIIISYLTTYNIVQANYYY